MTVECSTLNETSILIPPSFQGSQSIVEEQAEKNVRAVGLGESAGKYWTWL